MVLIQFSFFVYDLWHEYFSWKGEIYKLEFEAALKLLCKNFILRSLNEHLKLHKNILIWVRFFVIIVSSCDRTVDTVIYLHTWRRPAM